MPDIIANSADQPAARYLWWKRVGEWVEHHERVLISLAVGFQIVLLTTMAVGRAIPYVAGETILVRVVPRDPRDLFRGDYVVLTYDFSRVPPGGIDGIPRYYSARDMREWRGRTVYASLVPEADGRHWRLTNMSIHRPAAGKYLRGVIGSGGRIRYGIEAYYVPEGQGLRYENAIRGGNLSAEIALTPDGQAALRELHIE